MPDPSTVVIREAVPGDAEGMIAYLQTISAEPDNQILWGPGEFTATPDEEREMLRRVAASDNSVFIVAEDAGPIVGVADVSGGRSRAARHSGRIGITLHPDYREMGLGTQMMQWLIDWAKGTGVLTRLELEVFSHNPRAIHVYEKVGFVREGVKRNAFIKEGRYVDSVIMALLLDAE
jgi:RimJ/RimL family protein N-acetyltransferase